MHDRPTTATRTGRSSGRTRRRRHAVAALTAAAVLAALAGPAQAAPRPAGTAVLSATPSATVAGLPDGWSVAAGGTTLRWTSRTPLPLGGARLEVVADGAVLGTGRLSPDGRTVSLGVDAGAVKELSSLQLVAAGRRLDAGPTSVAAAAASRSAARVPSASPSELLSAAAASRTAAAAQTTLAAAADPGRPGPYRTRTGEYTLADLPVTGLPVPVEMTAVVVAPVRASGKRPLAVFLHGRHAPCYFVDGEPDTFPDSFWPCPAGWKPIPSYRGYLQSQQLLASQGWLTVSLSANGINAQDFAADDGGALARSELVRAHLARWASWAASGAAWASAPAVVRAGPRPDLSKVLLVGHSRGGEGVNRAALDSAVDRAARWKVKGQLLLAPTAFGRNPAPGVPTAVVLPYCDGDVFDLQGQAYLDDARDLATDRSLRSAVLVLGANHNFFNIEWTPGESVAPSSDDWFGSEDPTCGSAAPGRLSAAEQRAVGATYVAAAARVLVGRDAKAAPLLDGSAARAPSAGRAVVLTHALGARRDTLLRPGTATRVTTTGTATARLCDTGSAADPARRCIADATLVGATPHFPVGFFGVSGAPVRQIVEVGWSRRGGSARVRLGGPLSVAGHDSVALRVLAPPNAARARFGVRLVDADGTRLVLGDASVTGLPGGSDPTTQLPGKYWGQEVRVRLDAKKAAAAGLDLRKVVAVDLLPRSTTGKVWVLDAWGRRPGLAADRRVPFVRVDVGRLTIQEGDTGARDVRLPITVTGRLDRPAQVWLGAAGSGTGTPLAGLPKVVRIAPGTRQLNVKVPVVGNTLDDEDLQVPIFARGVRNAVGGNWVGSFSIADDDPPPDVTVTRDVTAVEGTSLVWTVRLSGPSNRFVPVDMVLQPVGASGRELDSDDVPEDWLLGVTGLESRPVPAVPLSSIGLFLGVFLDPGETTGTLEIPIAADATVEGTEQVSLRVLAPDELYPGYPGTPGLPDGADITGTVTDAP